MGIGGSGMAPLAEHALSKGFVVSGSDLDFNKLTQHLESLGIVIVKGHTPDLVKEADVVIYSSAIPTDSNQEILTAKATGKIILHRSELLAEFFNQTTISIGVAGTHGKTTCTAMISHCLQSLKIPLNAVCGGVMKNSNSSTYFSNQSNTFVSEIDESDGSIKNFFPSCGLITNIDEDHLDLHNDLATIEKIFHSYVNQIRDDGILILGWDGPILKDFFHQIERKNLDIITFGIDYGCDVRALDIHQEKESTTFTAMINKNKHTVILPMIGIFNVKNTLATLALAHALELDIEQTIQALSNFKGVEKRQSLLLSKANLKIFDDYAHNPTKIHSVLDGMRHAYPNANIIAVFEPHRHSRVRLMLDSFARAFSAVDSVIILPIYGAHEKDQGFSVISEETLMNRICQFSRVSSSVCHSLELHEILKKIEIKPEKENIIIALGAGYSSALCYKLADSFS